MEQQRRMDCESFSVIIPAYNEEDIIEDTIKKLQLAIADLPHEILVVDDGSTDKTAEQVKRFPVGLIQLSHNQGYGAALKNGIRMARHQMICIIDADGTYPVEQIPCLVNSFSKGKYDMVVGARTSKNIHIALMRRSAKWIIHKLANYLSGMKIIDLNSGLRVMKKEVVEKFIPILPDGFSFTSTITLAMLMNGYSVEYVPIDYFVRKGKSKFKPIKDTLNFFQLIIRMVLYFNPLRVFVPVSILLVIFSFLILFGSWLFFRKAMDVTFGVTFMTGVMVLAIGALADLIIKRDSIK